MASTRDPAVTVEGPEVVRDALEVLKAGCE